MKVVFAGPSLYGATFSARGLTLRPPAAVGDIIAAVRDGARVVGLVDGVFGLAASVWHKEILYALSNGVHVFGASSMGALRAAECQEFGMVPVGKIASAYASGALDDDAAVALTMAPAEFGFQPFVEPLVDVWATLDALEARGLISHTEATEIAKAAETIYFAERTPASFMSKAIPGQRAATIEALYLEHHVSQKTDDALELLEVVDGCVTDAPRTPLPWTFKNSPSWTRFLLAS